jgi:hypothetical protein
MIRTAILALALAGSPAFASSHYHAQPAAKPDAAKIVLRDTVWKCGDAGCEGSKSTSRPATVCAVLAKEVGTLRSFTADGSALSPEQLEKCNARAN